VPSCIRNQKKLVRMMGSSGRKYRSTSTTVSRLMMPVAHTHAAQYHCHLRPMGKKRFSAGRWSFPCLLRLTRVRTRAMPNKTAYPIPTPARTPMGSVGVQHQVTLTKVPLGRTSEGVYGWKVRRHHEPLDRDPLE
jgi:hypothetical protein